MNNRGTVDTDRDGGWMCCSVVERERERARGERDKEKEKERERESVFKQKQGYNYWEMF